MPMLRVAVTDTEPQLYKSEAPLAPALRQGLRGDGPVMILIHGFKFDPGIHGHDPHRHIFGYAPKGNFKAVSWPRHLGFGTGSSREGLCIAFGWPARGWFWDAYRKAEQASIALAALIAHIKEIAPHRPIHIMAHSLGARVCLGALPQLSPGNIRRAIFLGGCEYEQRAARAMESPAGRAAEILNITSRENDFYELMFERLILPEHWRDRGIGLGLRQARANWLDIQIDHPETRRTLSDFGLPIAETRHRICHWSTYNRRGVLRFYAELLRRPHTLPLAVLRARLPRQEPRYSRLLALPDLPQLLPSRAKRTS